MIIPHYYKFKRNRYLGISTYYSRGTVWSICLWCFEIGIRITNSPQIVEGSYLDDPMF
jgi:hypothetical protein